MDLQDSQIPLVDAFEEEPPQPRSRYWMVALQIAITWIVYVLSIGPMYWYWYGGKYATGPTIVAAFYEPLWILCAWIPPLGHFVNWYVRWWIL